MPNTTALDKQARISEETFGPTLGFDPLSETLLVLPFAEANRNVKYECITICVRLQEKSTPRKTARPRSTNESRPNRGRIVTFWGR